MKSKLIKISIGVVGLILIIQIPLFMKNKIPAEFQDPEKTTSELVLNKRNFDELGSEFAVKPITGSDGIPVFSSVAIAEFGESGFKTRNYKSDGVTSDDLFSADSMTKMVTAAAILRMTEEEKYQEFLRDGIDTKLSDLLPLLKTHYPNSNYIQRELESQPNFQNITLRHLAQHTSGLARVKSDAFRDSGQKLTPEEMIDAEKKLTAGEFGEKIGEYFYNDLGYELLGRVIVAVDREEKKDRARKFGDVVDELVIGRVREKIGEEEKQEQSEDLKFFTSDQMEIVDGETRVIGHPELSVKFGKDYHDGKLQETPSHFYDLASGGSYANAESMSKIAFHILHNDKKFSVFKKPETLAIFNGGQIPKRELDGSLNKQGKTYGFGYESYSDPAYQQFRTHGGSGYGSNSNAFVDTKNNKVAVAFVGSENLTLPLAYALIKGERAEAPITLSPEFYQKSLELVRDYSENQLVEMRKDLEKSYEEFENKFPTYSKKPSPSPAKSDVEKMVGEGKDGVNEI